jgi:hypothetical protein
MGMLFGSFGIEAWSRFPHEKIQPAESGLVIIRRNILKMRKLGRS